MREVLNGSDHPPPPRRGCDGGNYDVEEREAVWMKDRGSCCGGTGREDVHAKLMYIHWLCAHTMIGDGSIRRCTMWYLWEQQVAGGC